MIWNSSDFEVLTGTQEKVSTKHFNTSCYLCGNKECSNVFIENGIPIVKCKNCGHVFSTYKQDEHYQGYWGDDEKIYDIEWWDKAHKDLYKQFIQIFLTEKSGRILDVGCGLGFFLKLVRQIKPGWETIGYELSPPAVNFAKTKNGLDNIFNQPVEKSRIKNNSFDIITLWDVIEHIPVPQPKLKFLHSILKPGGILFLQTPNFPIQLKKAKLKKFFRGMNTDGHYLEAKDHINDYTQKTIVSLGNQCGFDKYQFFILKPILSLSGSRAQIGRYLKLLYYYVTKTLWLLSFKTVNLNNTLFVTFRK
ncbi:MAG: class I SAM-dependent methyltransferase [Leptospira sp.]|nr:class I SAM-dependent methyltransferase [Leptospira sp.]